MNGATFLDYKIQSIECDSYYSHVSQLELGADFVWQKNLLVEQDFSESVSQQERCGLWEASVEEQFMVEHEAVMRQALEEFFQSSSASFSEKICWRPRAQFEHILRQYPNQHNSQRLIENQILTENQRVSIRQFLQANTVQKVFQSYLQTVCQSASDDHTLFFWKLCKFHEHIFKDVKKFENLMEQTISLKIGDFIDSFQKDRRLQKLVIKIQSQMDRQKKEKLFVRLVVTILLALQGHFQNPFFRGQRSYGAQSSFDVITTASSGESDCEQFDNYRIPSKKIKLN